MTNYIRFDAETGEVDSFGFSQPELLKNYECCGKYIVIDTGAYHIDATAVRYDLRSGKIVQIDPEKPSASESVSSLREASYLAHWPITAQLEAHAEAAAGRPEKLEAMLASFAAIRAAHPMPESDR